MHRWGRMTGVFSIILMVTWLVAGAFPFPGQSGSSGVAIVPSPSPGVAAIRSSLLWPGVVLAILAAIGLLAGCGHRQRTAPLGPRIAIFPVQNEAGGSAPIRRLSDAVEAALGRKAVAAGVDVVLRGDIDAALSRERIRYTAGLDKRSAELRRYL